MRDNVYKFRRVKWGEPKKFKVLAEDLAPRSRPATFTALVCVLFLATFCLAYWLA
ncbi:hypothetical protein [Chelativorans sp. J32]|uniref:hypothetical protein n=1 Tax=Chelativorans sp. J32 TaxID=935840 RepID=UPI0004AD40DE|nr:hypothetical protein [Chelativorans sp. J32]